ncbi:MAG TPA: DUF1579 family protein [Myxococcales bacterium]|jgi:hypothetical protein
MAKKLFLGALAVSALVAALHTAQAQSPQPGGQQPTMGQQPMGPAQMQAQKNLQNALTQAQAIAPIFSNPVAWRGEVPAGVMGPNAPATTSQGTANCSPILQGAWYTCEVNDKMGSGTNASNWMGHMVVGYDATANSYKGVMIDNMGTGLETLDGTLTGKKFTLTTTAPVMMMGQSQKQRLSFDYTDPNNIQFTDERQYAGQQGWVLNEKATLKPYTSAATRQASTPTRR